jgi:hypothetical protein
MNQYEYVLINDHQILLIMAMANNSLVDQKEMVLRYKHLSVERERLLQKHAENQDDMLMLLMLMVDV